MRVMREGGSGRLLGVTWARRAVFSKSSRESLCRVTAQTAVAEVATREAAVRGALEAAGQALRFGNSRAL